MPQACDLGAHVRAVGDVQVFEGMRPGVLRGVAIPIEEHTAEIRATEPLEIHRKERDVGEDVAVPKAVVEFQAVDRTRPVVEAEDVVGEEVAVTVARMAAGDALFEERVPARQVATGERCDA